MVTTVIIEYLDLHYPGAHRLLPENEDQRLDARLWDRFFDLYVQEPMQKIVADRLRPADEHDPRGVADARAALRIVVSGKVRSRPSSRRTGNLPSGHRARKRALESLSMRFTISPAKGVPFSYSAMSTLWQKDASGW